MVHKQGIGVSVPGFVEISSRTTLKCMESMTQIQWEWISTGSLFKYLWKMSFDPTAQQGSVGEYIPATIEELNSGDPGVVHVAGMIVQGCEALMAGRNIFVRNPETLLHPVTERYIMGMFREMFKILGYRGTVQTVTQAPENIENDKDECLRWLRANDPDRAIAKISTRCITAIEAITMIESGSPIGQDIVDQYVNRRDRGGIECL